MNIYTVKPGDTLSAIAKALLGPGATYWDLVQYNPEISDPDVIEVGQLIRYPGEEKTTPVAAGKPMALPSLPKSKLNLVLYGAAGLMGLMAVMMALSPKDNVMV